MRYVPPESLVFEWEKVKTGLARVKQHSSEDWLPEDVYMSLKLNNSSLYIAEDKDGEYLGFLILQILPMFHGKRLHVWCAYSNDDKPLLRLFLRQMHELAKTAGASKITFTSPREEWMTVGKRGGFRPSQTTFELNI